MFLINFPATVDELGRQEPLVGVFLLAIGLMFMLMGLRLSRLIIGLSYGVVGFLVGASLPGLGDTARLVLGLVIASGLGLTSLWVNRPAVAVLGGLWAALVGIIVAGRMGIDGQVALVVGAVMFAAGASMAFVMFQELVALVSGLEGTLLVVGGLIVIVHQSPSLWYHMRDLVLNNPIFAPFMVMAGTTIGFYMQMAELQKKQTGRSA